MFGGVLSHIPTLLHHRIRIPVGVGMYYMYRTIVDVSEHHCIRYRTVSHCETYWCTNLLLYNQ